MQQQSKQILTRTLLASSLSLAFFGGQTALAEEAMNELDNIEVTADKEKAVTAKQLEQKQAASLQEIFKDKTDFTVGGGSLPAAQKLYARGLEDTMMNVSIDGAQQTGYLFHHQGRVGVDPDIIKAVEADAGTGAATAGPGALAGSVNVETKDATDILRKDEKAGAIVKSTYHSNGKGFKNTGTAFGRIGENSGLLVSASQLDTDSYQDGNGDTVKNTDIKQEDFFTKLSGDINEKHYASLSHENRVDEGNRNLRAHMIASDWNPETEQKNARSTTTFNHKYKSGNPLFNTKTTVYHTDASLDITNDGSQSGAGVETWGSDLRNTMNLDKADITFGTDYRHDRAYQTGAGTAGDEDLTVLGLYLQSDYRFAPDWMLSAGARFDHYDYNDNISQNFSSEGLSPNVGLTWFVSDEVNLFARHSRALRGVGTKEVYVMARTTNDSDIDPERAHTTEFGTEYEHGNLHAKVQGFSQRIENFIPNSTGTRDNEGTVRVWGYSADAGYRWGQLDSRVGVTLSRPTLNNEPLSDSNMSLGTSTGRTWTTGLDYHFTEQRVDIGWTGRATERLTEVPSGSKEKPGYAVHDAYVSWRPMANTDFDLKFAVINLFDKQFLDQASYGYTSRYNMWAGVPEAGRDFRLTASMRF